MYSVDIPYVYLSVFSYYDISTCYVIMTTDPAYIVLQLSNLDSRNGAMAYPARGLTESGG